MTRANGRLLLLAVIIAVVLSLASGWPYLPQQHSPDWDFCTTHRVEVDAAKVAQHSSYAVIHGQICP